MLNPKLIKQNCDSKLAVLQCILFLVGVLTGTFVRGSIFEGQWVGQLEESKGKIASFRHEISIRVSESRTGVLEATLYTPAWGEAEWPLATPTVMGNRIMAKVEAPSGKIGQFTLELSTSTNELKGQYEFGKDSYSITLKKGNEIHPLVRHKSQIPIGPYPYTLKPVHFSSGTLSIAGVLTIPKPSRNLPAIVLVPGSTAQLAQADIPGDMNPNVWISILSDRLARFGFVTLRTDSRGLGGTQGEYEKASIQELAADVQAARVFLSKQPEVSPNSIGVAGISQGASIAVLASSGSKEFAFVMMLSGSGVPGDELELEGLKRSWSQARMTTSPAYKVTIEMMTQGYKDSRAGLSSDEMFERLKRRFGDRAELGKAGSDVYLKRISANLALPLVRSVLSYDPRSSLRKCHIPILVLAGDLDTNTDPTTNIPEIEKSLKEGGNQHYKILQLPGLNHGLRKLDSNGSQDFIDELALTSMEEWLTASVKVR